MKIITYILVKLIIITSILCSFAERKKRLGASMNHLAWMKILLSQNSTNSTNSTQTNNTLGNSTNISANNSTKIGTKTTLPLKSNKTNSSNLTNKNSNETTEETKIITKTFVRKRKIQELPTANTTMNNSKTSNHNKVGINSSRNNIRNNISKFNSNKYKVSLTITKRSINCRQDIMFNCEEDCTLNGGMKSCFKKARLSYTTRRGLLRNRIKYNLCICNEKSFKYNILAKK